MRWLGHNLESRRTYSNQVETAAEGEWQGAKWEAPKIHEGRDMTSSKVSEKSGKDREREKHGVVILDIKTRPCYEW